MGTRNKEKKPTANQPKRPLNQPRNPRNQPDGKEPKGQTINQGSRQKKPSRSHGKQQKPSKTEGLRGETEKAARGKGKATLHHNELPQLNNQ
ncbi:hypothetical protein IEQ34_014293 [Dendrobium chrysotoxum]|uniref:Uncharacterized protein n=1 Tax=Dendrobium chrysotoxum TaxID=161865 RepID=A0AAV7GIU4_DENCH|nr:hypothetical protein IEQ34_014293 [Dendrobium chrysotoxum]